MTKPLTQKEVYITITQNLKDFIGNYGIQYRPTNELLQYGNQTTHIKAPFESNELVIPYGIAINPQQHPKLSMTLTKFTNLTDRNILTLSNIIMFFSDPKTEMVYTNEGRQKRNVMSVDMMTGLATYINPDLNNPHYQREVFDFTSVLIHYDKTLGLVALFNEQKTQINYYHISDLTQLYVDIKTYYEDTLASI